MGSTRWKSICALFYLLFVTFIYGLKEITAQLGQTVNLTCLGQDDVIGLVLTRSDLDPPYVFVFRDNRPDLTRQNKLFQDRVGLPGPLVTNDDGNVVLYLSNVNWSDNGSYTCQVHKRGGGGPVQTSFDVKVIEPDGRATPTDDTPSEDSPTEDQEDTFIIKLILIPMFVYGLVVVCFATFILITDREKKEMNN